MQIDILLSTFNSEKFLSDLLNSIFNQTHTNWKINIRDDCSEDGTLEIIKGFMLKYPDRIVLLDNPKNNVGVKENFALLLENTNAEYIMFCDHDDVWLPSKIEVTLKKMLEVESRHPNIPVLICTDLIIVDSELKEKNRSFWNFSKINPENVKNIYTLAINNPVVGCTVMINKRAKNISLPIPDKAIMHDWWIALKVASYGIIEFINQSTILYRQHASNSIGATRINLNYFLLRLKNIRITVRENMDAYQMLKLSNSEVNIIKFTFFKIKVTLTKLSFKK